MMAVRKSESLRTCLGCRMKKPQKEMLRIVGDPEGAATFDLAGRLPGRGAYVCPTLACLSVLKASALQHVLKRKVSLAPFDELRDSLQSSIERQIEGLLSIGLKAGRVVYGADAVAAALESGSGALLITACDASDRTVSRFQRIAAGISVRSVLGRSELGHLFGRSSVSVALVTSAGIARRLELMADRLTALKMSSYHDLN